VRTHFPKWEYDNETYFLACLLHDIGTAERFLATTKMSFEFKGAIVARDLILARGGPEDQADGVCEAIVRHQDIFVKGFVAIFRLVGTCQSDCSTTIPVAISP
jgi:cyanamide hydratase